jgi:oligoribonuclease
MKETKKEAMTNRFFWIDLEMTGLDDAQDSILEAAIVVTDSNFLSLEEFHRVVFQPPEILEGMNDWCKKTHGASGLTSAVAQGTPLPVVETEILGLIDRHFNPQDRIVLAGNSVGNDKRFVDRYMTQLAQRLHYRVIDVSSFKEIFHKKYNLSFQKKNTHRAIDDIHESIRELSFYLSYFQTSAGILNSPDGA